MQFSAFNAFCKFEVGDRVKDAEGNVMVITDIACVHYIKNRKIEFRFEFDKSQQYILIEEK
jgi:hypothetical protein